MKISIIIPIYNVEPYIEECLQSVASQTMTEGVECILVDDCGTDKSMEIVESFVNSYEGNIKFSIIHHEKNSGLSAARNSGIRVAKGEYVYFLDSDDTITADCLELMYSFIQKYGNLDLVQGSFYETEEEKKKTSKYNFSEHSNNKKQIKYFLLTYAGDLIPAQSRLIRRELIIKYNLFFKCGIIHEDNYWTFFLSKHINHMCFCSCKTYYHRYNSESITKKTNTLKEINAYNVIIKELCKHIDPFLSGRQKEYIINNLITAINNKYFYSENDKNNLINLVSNICNCIERILFRFYLGIDNSLLKTKVLHALFRIMKL